MSQNRSETLSKADNIKRREMILAIKDVKERNKEIAYWVVDTLWDMKRSEAPHPPQAYLDFNAASPEAQRKFAQAGFWDKEEVQKFIEGKGKAINENRENIRWLQENLEYLPEGDLISREKMMKKIDEISAGKLKQTGEIKVDWNG